jgi:hypothetical protein
MNERLIQRPPDIEEDPLVAWPPQTVAKSRMLALAKRIVWEISFGQVGNTTMA